MKVFRVPFEYALYDMSYANLSLYGAALPSYVPKKDRENSPKHDGDTFRADDRANSDKLEQFFNSIRN